MATLGLITKFIFIFAVIIVILFMAFIGYLFLLLNYFTGDDEYEEG